MIIEHVNPVGWVDTEEADKIQPSEVAGLVHQVTLEPGDLMQGPKGDKGDAGAAGADGAQGPKGDTGAAGADGAQGPKGDTGAAGADGAQGPKGDTGAAGDVGAQGLKGDTGAAGDDGAQGPKGDKGDTGAAGGTVQAAIMKFGGAAAAMTVGAWGVVKFDAIDRQSAAICDTANNWIKPTIAGYYLVSASVYMAVAQTLLVLAISKNNDAAQGVSGADLRSSARAVGLSGLVYLNGTTDYVTVKVLPGTDGALTPIACCFSAALVCAG